MCLSQFAQGVKRKIISIVVRPQQTGFLNAYIENEVPRKTVRQMMEQTINDGVKIQVRKITNRSTRTLVYLVMTISRLFTLTF